MANERLMAHVRHINFVDTDDKDEAARLAVELIREGKADILMKGMINTDNLLKAVINKQTGILPQGKVLTHVAAAFIPGYPKMLCFTDAAVIPYPTQQQRIAQVNYMAYVCHALGIEEPRIALCHCSEKVQEKHFPFTVGYREIVDMAAEGQFGKCIVDGPMDVKCACSRYQVAGQRSGRCAHIPRHRGWKLVLQDYNAVLQCRYSCHPSGCLVPGGAALACRQLNVEVLQPGPRGALMLL